MSREKAGEMFPDFSGDDYMWLQKGEDYEYFLSFEMCIRDRPYEDERYGWRIGG